ncbi:hypothetical protein SAMN05444373_10422 [Thermoclostridium caenicola]|uniref:Uncharacterized protein n=1 Tax=Thermoclostridium caenicola TaxID=659425 RepID=A0A1M6IDY7_9FIRM|nr:hypothetical protein [Thermoclostridium caenicola]SHJ32667.1 hypothetical protein SAMN05444373_10422 [Thermoclostridium caenicola]HPO75946.1 hypothetical protein [Thermoclostridium caenicola]
MLQHAFLLPEMLDYAEKELSVIDGGKRILSVWVTDKEYDKIEMLSRNGYYKAYSEPVRIFPYSKPFPEVRLPDGFSVLSLEDENCHNSCYGRHEENKGTRRGVLFWRCA